MDKTNIYQKARLSKDSRFDGKFYTAVITTGIFCRPICPARAPKPENVIYFTHAVQAQNAGFRPCKRCLPELAPQTAMPVKIKQLTDAIESGDTLAAIANVFELSVRQISRIFIKHYGVTPSKYLHNQRLLTARKLLRSTNLSITDIAFSAGFHSVRRFNEAIKNAYLCTPSDLRNRNFSTDNSAITVHLPYRPPFDWPLMLSFFRQRQLLDVEQVTDDEYRRMIIIESNDNLQTCQGWFTVCNVSNKSALKLTVQLTNFRYLNKVIKQVRVMFDLDADMVLIHQQLSQQPILAKVIRKHAGLRLPGCWDIFEFSIRAILGQQVSVKAATTLANRIAVKYGSPAANNAFGLSYNFPTPADLMKANYEGIGLTKSRINTLKHWLEFYQKDNRIFSCYSSLALLEESLISIKGIGPWTVNYIAMRGLSDPDAFPSADLGIIKALTIDGIKPNNKSILSMSEQWRPWRAYAAIYLWHSLAAH